MMKKVLVFIFAAAALFSCTKPQPHLSADESMQKGLVLFQKKKYDDAIAMFENSIMEAETPDMAAKAQLFLADSYFLSKRYPEAIPAYQQYLDVYGSSEDANTAMLRLGLSHYALIDKMDRDMSAAEGALRNFSTLREKDPGFAKEFDLTKKIVELRNMLADRELYVAKFYIRIKEPKAGIKRLDFIIERYKDTTAYEEALYAYGVYYAGQEGMENEALKYFNQLLKEKPETKYAKDVAKQLVTLLDRVQKRLDKKGA
jgi:outer membrane protein assembly factor BamD